jgi:hypothetical protein
MHIDLNKQRHGRHGHHQSPIKVVSVIDSLVRFGLWIQLSILLLGRVTFLQQKG